MRKFFGMLCVIIAATGTAEARNNPQRDINNAVNSVMDAHERRNRACWESSASSCRSASAKVALACQFFLGVRKDVRSADIFWPDSTQQANRICRDPFRSGGISPRTVVRRQRDFSPHFGNVSGDDMEKIFEFAKRGFDAFDRMNPPSAPDIPFCEGGIQTDCMEAMPGFGPPPDLALNTSPPEMPGMGTDYFPPPPAKSPIPQPRPAPEARVAEAPEPFVVYEPPVMPAPSAPPTVVVPAPVPPAPSAPPTVVVPVTPAPPVQQTIVVPPVEPKAAEKPAVRVIEPQEHVTPSTSYFGESSTSRWVLICGGIVILAFLILLLLQRRPKKAAPHTPRKPTKAQLAEENAQLKKVLELMQQERNTPPTT